MTGLGSPVEGFVSVPPLRAGDLLAGRYQIEARIGSGASGTVLRAFDRATRSVVAVKILKPELAADPSWVHRLSRELRVGRQIQHENVCRVFDVGEADGYRFLTMEIATGGSMAASLRARRELPPLAERVTDARAIVAGVAALHAAGVVHRDIKPDNILRMSDGRLVVSDFGVATDPGMGATSTTLVGTPSYMAPEVALGGRGSQAGDVFSLGIVLHELLFGTRPEWGAVDDDGLAPPPPPSCRVGANLAALCRRCLDPVPGSRPASAVGVLTLFDSAVGGGGAPPPLRRHRPPFTFWIGTLVVALLVILVGANRWWSRAAASRAPRAVADASRGAPVSTPVGTAADWTRGASTLARFAGHIDCYALIEAQRVLRVVWGAPSRAEDLDLATGRRSAATLRPETFAEGCPELSPDGRRVLFVHSEADMGTYVFMGLGPDGRDAHKIVKGSRPKWLPDGAEFVFDLDSRYPAVFSLPTGELTLVGETMTGARQLAEKAVDASGQHLALRFFDDAIHSRIVVQSLATLELETSFVVPPSAARLAFRGRGPRLTFTLYGDAGHAELIDADWRRGLLRRWGRTPDADVVAILETGSSALVLSRQIRLDAWVDAGGAAGPRRLTRDGTSDGGALSAHGDLLIQKFLGDRRYVIVARRADGTERRLTAGPMDMSPSFFPDADRWVYASYETQHLFQCRLGTGHCADVHLDPNTPAWPTADPFADRVAYVTLLNTSRLRIFDLATSSARDLGPVSNLCAPLWVSPGRLWALQSATSQAIWAEFDVDAGARTGHTSSRPAPDALSSNGRTLVDGGGEDWPCGPPAPLREAARSAAPRVFAVAEERSQVQVLPGALEEADAAGSTAERRLAPAAATAAVIR